MACPGCTPSERLYGCRVFTSLEISKKKKEWVELRSNSKLFAILRVCARGPEDDYRGRFIPSLSSHSMWVTCLHPLCFHTLRRQCCLILFNLGHILGNVPQAAHNRLLGLWPFVLTVLVQLSQLRRRLQCSLFQLLTHIFFSVCGQGFSRATPLCCYCCPWDILQEFLERASVFFNIFIACNLLSDI